MLKRANLVQLHLIENSADAPRTNIITNALGWRRIGSVHAVKLAGLLLQRHLAQDGLDPLLNGAWYKIVCDYSFSHRPIPQSI